MPAPFLKFKPSVFTVAVVVDVLSLLFVLLFDIDIYEDDAHPCFPDVVSILYHPLDDCNILTFSFFFTLVTTV